MVISFSSLSMKGTTTCKFGFQIQARAQNSEDEGKKSMSIVDANMGVLKERVGMIKWRDRLKKGYNRREHGWNYMKSYESCEFKLKKDVRFREFLEVVELVFGGIGLSIVGCTILLCFVSFLIHL
ncbi:hypothetical protein IHE45_16G026100 [Dioscorea alata]|uniref:Uncharacterized protein n=1 Tax=Dioscorea alata TaxID=55571 RepID=A0ACB7UG84_DIOAL|nr:hypothetical protein IHE45_16G026100 [Dioscorea alata]